FASMGDQSTALASGRVTERVGRFRPTLAARFRPAWCFFIRTSAHPSIRDILGHCRPRESSALLSRCLPMHREPLFAAALIGGSIAAGWIGWSGVSLLLPTALLFPLIWSAAPTRSVAALVSAGYFLA